MASTEPIREPREDPYLSREVLMIVSILGLAALVVFVLQRV